tara:strand:- start:1359 stop:1601 length:243 start_codon:yes stop_codon:yes gene_type:complete
MSCGFNKTDLQNIVNIIEVCTKRGAFVAEELSGVGLLYDRLKKGLNIINQNTVTPSETTSETPSEECCKDGVCPISNCGT